MATAVLAGCADDEILASYQGEEISFRTRMETRATEMTLNNLKDFKVWGDAENYPSFFLENGTATQDGTDKTHYDLTTQDGLKVYWPTGVEKIHFWAYAPSDIRITANINKTTQQLTGYTLASEFAEGGKKHQDLIVAHALATHGDHGTSVDLTFHHALSNISLKLKSGDPTKFMRVKGAWFVNAKNSGSVSFVSDAQPIEWNTDGATDAVYGVTFSEIPSVNNVAASIIIGNGTDLMLIPQNVNKVAFSAADGTVTSGKSYILLLCQILSVHPGATHEDGEVSQAADDAKHYHQLFPENNNVFSDESEFTTEFGYTCVPVNFNWTEGKRYAYTLEFCGKNSGGGIYPPENLPEGLPTEGVKPRPDGKNPGDKILDNPISFDVTVEGWKDAGSEFTGDVPMQ